MAYSNVGTPRFYIDHLLHSLSSGDGTTFYNNVFRLDPSSITSSGNFGTTAEFTIINVNMPIKANYVAILGHSMATEGMDFNLKWEDSTGGAPIGYLHNASNKESIINYAMSATIPQHDGFSILKFDDEDLSAHDQFQFFNYHGEIGWNVGAISLGRIYEMNHSPELSLTMERQMDGVKRVRTKGGADLVDHKYTKPAMWGDLAAWELGEEVARQTRTTGQSGKRFRWGMHDHLSGFSVGSIWDGNIQHAHSVWGKGHHESGIPYGFSTGEHVHILETWQTLYDYPSEWLEHHHNIEQFGEHPRGTSGEHEHGQSSLGIHTSEVANVQEVGEHYPHRHEIYSRTGGRHSHFGGQLDPDPRSGGRDESIPPQALSRVGRRVWNLSFNYLSQESTFPKYSSLTTLETDDVSSPSPDQYTLLDSNDFFSEVVNKVQNGRFIFQPDRNNNNPDSFAICKFDMNEFSFEQVTKGIYNINLKIREVW
tara:strand:+ start:2203 stop:3645 length:1443 start_codon:yes stop_codon:yes gene_type:complete